jgi:hypothetical protein
MSHYYDSLFCLNVLFENGENTRILDVKLFMNSIFLDWEARKSISNNTSNLPKKLIHSRLHFAEKVTVCQKEAKILIYFPTSQTYPKLRELIIYIEEYHELESMKLVYNNYLVKCDYPIIFYNKVFPKKYYGIQLNKFR